MGMKERFSQRSTGGSVRLCLGDSAGQGLLAWYAECPGFSGDREAVASLKLDKSLDQGLLDSSICFTQAHQRESSVTGILPMKGL